MQRRLLDAVPEADVLVQSCVVLDNLVRAREAAGGRLHPCGAPEFDSGPKLVAGGGGEKVALKQVFVMQRDPLIAAQNAVRRIQGIRELCVH
jgi:hypothetical protein